MKFKTVSAFIHALEVEGEKFVHPTSPDHFLEWKDGSLKETPKSLSGLSFSYPAHSSHIERDWQEYIPEPETEEIVLEEWLAEDWLTSDRAHGAQYFVRWVEKGATLPLKEAFKTGVTRKVKVPK